MLRWAVTATGAAALVLLCGPGCDGVDHPDNGPNAPCTRNKDCRHELRCVSGVCLDPDARDASVGVDGATNDGPSDAGVDG